MEVLGSQPEYRFSASAMEMLAERIKTEARAKRIALIVSLPP
jgi:hypothetical protein